MRQLATPRRTSTDAVLIAGAVLFLFATAIDAQTPYHGSPISVPGVWEAEDFDFGGEGIAYHDNVPGNAGGQYRPNEDVDIIASTDPDDPPSDAYVVNNFETGEWLVYTIQVASSGLYDGAVRVADNNWAPTPEFHIEVDGVNVTGSIAVPSTDSWNEFEWVAFSGVSLSAGQHLLKIVSDGQYFDLNRIRLTPAPSQPTSLLFWSGFENATTLGSPTECSGITCWQYLTDSDSSTGNAWHPPVWQRAGSVGHFQLLADAPVNTATISTYIVNRLDGGTGRNGSRSLYSEIMQSGCCGTDSQVGGATQDPYVIHPAGTQDDLYLSYWLKFQPDLDALMGQCGPNFDHQWRVPFEVKTAGDYRVILQVAKDRDPNSCAFIGPMYWLVAGDNEANCNLYTPPPLKQCPTAPTNVWSAQNRSVAVPVDQWFKLEVFWHRSSDNDGRVWMAVDGQVIADHFGPNTGDWNAPIDRIMTNQLYTSTAYPVFQWVDDLQIWQAFPTANSGDAWYDPPYAPH